MGMNLQLFGGRGAGGNGNGPKTVDIEKWGDMINSYSGNVSIKDETRWIEEEFVEKSFKTRLLQEIDAWRNDDGTWTDDDFAGYIVYENGDFVDVKDLGGKNYKRNGIIGVYSSGPSGESAWGDEHMGRNKQRVPMTITTEDGREFSNSSRYYKATGYYYERVKTTYPTKQGERTQRTVLQRSTVKQLSPDWDKPQRKKK